MPQPSSALAELQEWAAAIPVGVRYVTFLAGELIRCPGIRELRHVRVVCGHSDGSRAGPGTVVTVIAERRHQPRPGATSVLRRCDRCRSTLQLVTQPAAPGPA